MNSTGKLPLASVETSHPQDLRPTDVSGVLGYPALDAASNPLLVKLVSHIFNESFGYRPDGKPYRLGPKSVAERLQETDYLFIAGDEHSGVGYLFGKQILSSQGVVAWIESMAVLPLYRRRGVATAMVRNFCGATKDSALLGCATPNPIAALVITRAVGGVTYLEGSNPPPEEISMIEAIRPKCPDFRGADFNPTRLLVKTRFTPVRSEDTTEWRPPHPSEPPPWWASLANLPQEYEALLIIDRAQPVHLSFELHRC